MELVNSGCLISSTRFVKQCSLPQEQAWLRCLKGYKRINVASNKTDLIRMLNGNVTYMRILAVSEGTDPPVVGPCWELRECNPPHRAKEAWSIYTVKISIKGLGGPSSVLR